MAAVCATAQDASRGSVEVDERDGSSSLAPRGRSGLRAALELQQAPAYSAYHDAASVDEIK
ncbi:uncharacterized protein L969DRAFT_46701 [Mixia osmundae IAM 14324]|uniref:Uncharacterized protein n=1 Tax=Mixia osmundae (strain CBS 9802 / IAM 14324 / JCM 22182 / KY 12970) TaxID=764103 RepID=G7EAP2_MIXOS|nr:uncharacterized protein L969DRAFT_46701 [Mixia osmundae IAM 14324]KEI40871.1 hypothetical protein L969DRAFT_46701 [Mixia osmundae IAM 14324]GAA99902.1 hypothetical protein E5Q_06605 [Mixia osmundae IAM 14324]